MTPVQFDALAMAGAIVAALADAAVETTSQPCSAHGCDRSARYAICFKDQSGHVHDCEQCTAGLREWCDVVEVALLPCPWCDGDGYGVKWTDTPRELT